MTESIYSNGSYLANNKSWHQEDSEWKADKVHDIMKKNNMTAKIIGEVGCGAGEVLSQLSIKSDSYSMYYGYEISPDAYNLCKPKERDNLKFVLINSIKDIKRHYDLLLCIDIIEHIEDYLGFLRNIKLKASNFIFHIPLDICVTSVLTDHFIKWRRKVGHIHYFTKGTAISSLEDAGFEIIDFCYTKGSIDLPSDSLQQFFLKLPRMLFSSINEDLAVRLLGGQSLLVLAK
jgi:cyclopropane fatty-acyl-phospholipid synthase-like methyltransferase